MKKCSHFLPGFKTSCITISILYILMAGSLFLRGLMPSMAGYGVPAETLQSPHYYDAIFWVYTHMLVLGLIIGFAGLYAEGQVFRQRISWLLFAAHLVYTFLDFRSSDSAIGNGLYLGGASLIPAFISLAFTILFLHLSLCHKSRA